MPHLSQVALSSSSVCPRASIASVFVLPHLHVYVFTPFSVQEAGIVTMSKYDIESSVRYSLPIDESFPTKFFDLDRCFMITRYRAGDSKELVLINVHLSAYDEGGVYRKKQLELLNEVLKQERDKGNYVIAGGDFNHDIAESLNLKPLIREVRLTFQQPIQIF